VSPDGFVLVDKPLGWTSHQVVGRLRRLLGTKKIGHAGTLDPLATGLLVCGVGRATRLLGDLMGEDKLYRATVRFGQETSTEDAEGDITASRGVDGLDLETVRAVSAQWLGAVDQVPSAVSAIKVQGQRAYRLVRAGETPDLAPRRVRIDRIEWGSARPGDGWLDAEVTVACSAGTYIRALARDIGRGVGTGAHLVALRRLQSGSFKVAEARVDQARLEGADPVDVWPIRAVMARVLPLLRTDADTARRVGYGQALDQVLSGPTLIVGPGDEALAVYVPDDGRAVARTVLVGGS
jgi:tRNA pseudouridine55 synthase